MTKAAKEPSGTNRRETIVVPPEEAGMRIDRFLAGRFSSHSRSMLQRLIRDGCVLVGGAAVRPSLDVRAGDAIEILFPVPAQQELEPEAMEIRVLYEDADLLVLEKPAGLVVHPGAGAERGTLVHGLLARSGPLSKIGGPRRPGIVHRLDKGTSGVMVVACSDRAHLALIAQFAGREVAKIYLALVWGHMRERVGTIEQAIGRDPSNRKKMSVRAPAGRAAASAWRVLRELPGFSLLEVRPRTGRTHQIRVHLQSLGHPIVGDESYGGAGWRGVQDPRRRAALRGFRRLALHASKLSFRHPVSGEPLAFAVPLPVEFRALLETLET